MASAGIPGSQRPAGIDQIPRQIKDIERAHQELASSIPLSLAPIVAAQNAQIAAIAAATAAAAAAAAQATANVAVIAATVADLASRVTVTAAVATFNTGSLPNDSTFHAYGPDIPITINVPTGKVVVTVGCGQATIAPGGGAVTAEATFSISGGSVNYGDVYARGYAYPPIAVGGSSLSVQRAFTLPPGSYVITGEMRAWASGSATGSVNFSNPYLTVQVTG